MRKIALSILLMSVFLFLMSTAQPIVADPQVEIIISDTDVFRNEEFSFDVRLTNPEALAYDGFHLYSEGTEELDWGSHTFNGEDYTLYTHRYTIGLGELGYYTIRVEAFSFFNASMEIVDSIIIYVSERPQSIQFPAVMSIPVIAVGFVLCVMIVRRRKGKREPQPPPALPDTIEAEPIRERERIVTERVLVICPFCGAKTEQGLTKCQNCQADL